jgi:Icc protein
LPGRILAIVAVALLTTVFGGCLLPDEMQGQTRKNLARLPADRPPISPEHPLSFAFVSDTHDGYENWHGIVGEINQRPEIELVVHSGDFTDFGGQQEYIWFHRDARLLDAPVFVSTGNHDGLINGATLYARMFGDDNFAFDYRGLHFVFFNTNTLEWDNNEPDLAWLAQQKAPLVPAADGGPGVPEPVVLVTHHPPRSQPHLTPEVTVRYWTALKELPVDLYLYGHIHDDFLATTINSVRFVKAQAALHGAYNVLTTTDGRTFTIENCLAGDGCVPGSLDGTDDIPGVSAIDASQPPADEYP